MKAYRFITDPGHGWLEVPVRELIALGIAGDISTFSYLSRPGGQASEAMAYLEEDCDLARFATAKGKAEGIRDPMKWDFGGIEEVYQDPTFVRQLPHYRAPQQDTFDTPLRGKPKVDILDPAPDEDFEPLDAEQREALRIDLEDDARTIHAADLYSMDPPASFHSCPDCQASWSQHSESGDCPLPQ